MNFCIYENEKENYFNSILLPKVKSIIPNYDMKSKHIHYILEFLGNYFIQIDQLSENHDEIWNSMLLLFKELNELDGLYTFLIQHARPDCNYDLWRSPILDQIAEQASSSISQFNSNLFKFLTFTMGGNTMTKGKFFSFFSFFI